MTDQTLTASAERRLLASRDTTSSARGRLIVWLGEAAALDQRLTGAKAANLALAETAGLPVLPGFVVTTAAPTFGGAAAAAELDGLRAGWARLSDGGAQPLVVRSSSTVEDAQGSSLAGRFVSEVGVRGWDAFAAAVVAVQVSAQRVLGPDGHPAPMAVLCQPMVPAVTGGVLFGIDPVIGDRRHLVVEAVPGGPQALVDGSGAVEHITLSRRGRPDRRGWQRRRSLVDRRQLRRLAHLSRQVQRLFGGPQDVEWAVDGGGRLWLLQSRPVTAMAERPARGSPLLGPGPVGETLPDPLHPLEIDLWVMPLREGMAEALRVCRAVPRRRLTLSPLVTVVDGWVACDLEVLGVSPRHRSWLTTLDPRCGLLRLAGAWRVGRLRAALPALVADVVAETDAELSLLAPLHEYDDAALLVLIERGRRLLVSLHGYQILAGMILARSDAPTVASQALRALAAGRQEARSDAAIIAEYPVVLALTAPRVGPAAQLPAPPADTRADWLPDELARAEPREALRLRARWVQELTARAAWLLATRQAVAGRLARADDARHLRLNELARLLRGGALPGDVASRRCHRFGPPLPAAFRLTEGGAVVAYRPPGSAPGGGRAVSGGRGIGCVRAEPRASADGERDVLVVRTLDPRLAPALPGLAGLVAETGGALSHLAILAREYGVPVVVGVPDAVRRFPPGTHLLVDGTTGEVSVVRDSEVAR